MIALRKKSRSATPHGGGYLQYAEDNVVVFDVRSGNQPWRETCGIQCVHNVVMNLLTINGLIPIS